MNMPGTYPCRSQLGIQIIASKQCAWIMVSDAIGDQLAREGSENFMRVAGSPDGDAVVVHRSC